MLDEYRFHIRPMLEEDIDTVFEIEQRAYEFPWTRNIISDCLRVGYVCYVYELADQVVAYAFISTGAGEAHLLNLCVDPDYQGKGIAKQFLEFLLDTLKRYHVQQVFLEVRQSNTVAIHIYHQYGFVEVGERRGYYPDHNGREDATVMAKELL